MRRVAIYVRVSTEDQARDGYSLDAQEKKLKAYCTLRTEWDVVDVYRDEGYSGRNPNRPEYRRMMSEIDRWDILLVLKMDRIHRNSVNFTEMMSHLNSHGKDFTSMMEKFDTTTAMGRFVMDIIQRMAQLESERTGERVKLAMTKKAKDGDGPMGSGEPYGYRYANGKLLVVEYEAEVVRRIFDMHLSGSSLGAIVNSLINSNIPTKNGGTWTRMTVWKILHNPLYAGVLRWDGRNYGTDNLPAIVSRSTYEAVNGPIVMQ
ncbi:MAG: recombinase family protein [archaeon]|nr:recombinase family protein [archaeon]